jgi:hypothetical protein
MSTNYNKPGMVMKIAGVNALSASKPAGYLHQIGGIVGIVVADIVGTGVDFYVGSAVGSPLMVGKGDGVGDMDVVGVWDVLIASGITLALGMALYYDGTNNNVNDTNTGHLAGHLWPQDDGTASRAVAADDPSWMASASPASVAVRVRLLGFPKTGLV